MPQAPVFEQVTLRFGDKTVFSDFSHRFAAQQTTCITGPSGCGKTSLLRLAMGLLTPQDGAVLRDETARMSVCFQEDRLCERLTAAANVAMPSPGLGRAKIEQALHTAGLGDALHQPVCALSGGQRRRVALLRALLADFELLFLDEPFTGLDDQSRALMRDLLAQYTAGKTVLLVTHDHSLPAALGAQLLALQ